MAKQEKIPLDIYWTEGLLELFNSDFPHEDNDDRRIGFSLGRQVVGLYLIELLIMYALDDSHITYKSDHNLRKLYGLLPRHKKRAVERKYKELLNSKHDSTWDFAKTAESFLEYLGENPITDSRYFWKRPHTEHRSILFLPNLLSNLVWALFISLHDYPQDGPIEKRFQTQFISFRDSLTD